MGDFRSNSRSGFSRGTGRPRSGGFSRGGDRGGSGGFGGERRSFGNGGRRSRSFENRSGGFGGGSRDFGERRPVEMHETTCDKCKQQCKVPFRPTGDKPVYCSACFEQTGNSGSRRNFEQASSGMSKEQFAEINAKLDKILTALSELEIVEDSLEGDDEESEDAEEIVDEDDEKDNINTSSIDNIEEEESDDESETK